MGKIYSAPRVLIYTLLNCVMAFYAADETVNIAAILDMNTPAGKAANTSLQFALQDVNGSRLNLTIQESTGFVWNVLQVFRSEPAAILVQDPKISKFLAPIVEEFHVPILSFSGYPGHGTARDSKYLLPTSFPTRCDDMKAIGAMAGYFQWKSVVVVYEDEEFWLNGVYQLAEAVKEFQEDWGSNKTTISQTIAFSSASKAEEIKETFIELNSTSGVRAFIVHTSETMALEIFSIAKKLGMMGETYVWVVTDSVASSLDSLPYSSIQMLQGILGVKSTATSEFIELQKRLRLSSADYGISRTGIQAYTSLKLFASAVSTLSSQSIKVGYDGQVPMNDTDFFDSMMVLRGGELLREKIAQALSGPARDGLEIREYEIINVVGRSYKTVGFWRRDSGQLQSARGEENKLGAVIWPGDTTQVPNGYRTLRIAKVGGNRTSNFTEFIGRVSGYTKETFQAAVNTLPYNLPVVYEDFHKEKSGYANLSIYDALVSVIANENTFDAVMGDATILWNRSLYVDFTQPYTQTGLVMLVRMERVREKASSFLHPFSAGLWAIAGFFLVITAFLVWLMEHEHNDEFKGKLSKQIVTSLAMSFSAFVFAQKEEVKSSLGKGIVATWLFIALILNNSYTAHLTSILTVERLAPTLTTMKSLSTSNVKVGFMATSFAKNYLLHDLNISEDRLVPLMSPYDYMQKLASGEVGAIVDESLYIQIVKSLYPCEKLQVVDRGYFDTGGFGFFFRKGSPFLSDMTEAVLNVSEQHFTVQSIKNKWFGEGTSCPDIVTGLQSDNTPITLANLWILFALTASIYALTTFIHIVQKCRQNRQYLRALTNSQDFSRRIRTMINPLNTVRAPPVTEIAG